MNKIFYFFVFIILIIICIVFYQIYFFTHIDAQFKELRPIHNKLQVYYKGIVVGKAKELKHSDSFEHTIIKIVLFSKKLKLPNNTKVVLKKEKRNDVELDFLELIYPEEPSKTILKNHDTIEGILAQSAQDLLSNYHGNELEIIKENLVESSENLNYALQELGQLFEIANEILKENKTNIFTTTKSFKNVSKKFDNSIKQNQLENSLNSIENSLNNVTGMTSTLNQATPKLDNGLNEIQESICNLNSITCGIRKTLSKNFSLIRLFFGKIIE